MKQKKMEYEALGWRVRSSGVGGYFCDGPDGEKHAIAFHEYDAETHERLYPEVKSRPKARSV